MVVVVVLLADTLLLLLLNVLMMINKTAPVPIFCWPLLALLVVTRGRCCQCSTLCSTIMCHEPPVSQSVS